ncbi:MAG: LysR family transcriptional regulator [Burkholderiales bacterium]|nr:LysR family transcriptional regulator [Burkholderiales bacterium]
MAKPTIRFDLISLRLFLSVLEESSFTRAATREHITAPAVSKRISELEAQLGVQLFERHSSGVRPTAAGRALEVDARSMFATLDRMQTLAGDYASGERGEVRLYANASSIVDTLPDEMRRFSRRHPHIQIRLDEGRSTEVVDAVTSGRADIGIFVPNIPAPELETAPYRKVALVLITPVDHPLAAHGSAAFAEAAAYDFVGLSDTSSIGMRIRSAAANAGIHSHTAIQVTTFEAMRRMVQAGMGIGILPESCAAPYAQGLGLCCIPLTDDWASYHLSLCVRHADTLPTATRLLFHFLSEQAADH